MSELDEMATRIMAMESCPDENDYDRTIDWMIKQIVLWLQAHPEKINEPTEMEYDWDGDPDHGSEGAKPKFMTAEGWHPQMKRDGVDLPEGFTGFMWGCAVNGARAIVGAPEVPNPAIIRI